MYQQVEELFLVTILIMNTATNRQKLENAVFQTAAIAQKYNCALKRLDFQQEEGCLVSKGVHVSFLGEGYIPDVTKTRELGNMIEAYPDYVISGLRR